MGSKPGDALVRKDRYDEAEPILRRSGHSREGARAGAPRLRLQPQQPGGALSCARPLPGGGGLARRAVAIQQRILGADHPITAMCISNLAELYRIQGRYEQAEPLHRRALAIREKALRPTHPDLATSLNHLAELYHAQGRYREGRAALRARTCDPRKCLGPTQRSRRVATVRSNLARIHKAKGRYEEPSCS